MWPVSRPFFQNFFMHRFISVPNTSETKIYNLHFWGARRRVSEAKVVYQSISPHCKTTCLAFLNILILVDCYQAEIPENSGYVRLISLFKGRFRLWGLRKEIWSGVEKQREGCGLFFSSLFFCPVHHYLNTWKRLLKRSDQRLISPSCKT